MPKEKHNRRRRAPAVIIPNDQRRKIVGTGAARSRLRRSSSRKLGRISLSSRFLGSIGIAAALSGYLGGKINYDSNFERDVYGQAGLYDNNTTSLEEGQRELL